MLGNGCKIRPLWGIRFTCTGCPDFDLCEGFRRFYFSLNNKTSRFDFIIGKGCYDNKIVPEELHKIHDSSKHRFEAIEVITIIYNLIVVTKSLMY